MKVSALIILFSFLSFSSFALVGGGGMSEGTGTPVGDIGKGGGGTGAGEGGGGTGSCSALPTETTPQGVFTKLHTITNAALGPDGKGIGKNDGTNAKVFNIADGLLALPLADGVAAVTQKFNNGKDFNTFQANAQYALESAVKKPYGYVDNSGFYTAAMLKTWIKSLEPTVVQNMVAQKQFKGVYLLEVAKLQPSEKVALSNSGHANCSDLLMIENEGVKQLKCMNYSTSSVTCESGSPTYACKHTTIKAKIGAYLQALTVNQEAELPYAAWASHLNQLLAETNQDTNSAIQSGMIFYENSFGGISCALKATDAHAEIGTLATYNGKKYLKVPAAREEKFCKTLFRMSAFNPKFDEVEILTNLPEQVLADLDGTEQTQTNPTPDTLTSLGFKPQFEAYLGTTAKPYTLNHTTLNYSGDLLNSAIHLDESPKPVAVLSLNETCSAGGGFKP